MEIEKYKALITAIDTGSLAAAAQKLGYTTSGISRMMASLENEMGLHLLNRSKGGVQPTSDCEKILPEIRTLLTSADQLNKKSAALHGIISGKIRIGTAYNYYYSALSKTIKHFNKRYPDVSVEIISGYSTNLSQLLHDHKLDVCIISHRDNTNKWISLCKDDMIAAIASSNPLSNRKSFPMSGFTIHPYIQTHPDADSDSARIFSRYNIIPNIKYRTEDSMATFSMVAANLGVTMNNQLNARLWHKKDITTLPLRPKQKIDIGIEISNEADNAAYYFIDVLLQYIH